MVTLMERKEVMGPIARYVLDILRGDVPSGAAQQIVEGMTRPGAVQNARPARLRPCRRVQRTWHRNHRGGVELPWVGSEIPELREKEPLDAGPVIIEVERASRLLL